MFNYLPQVARRTKVNKKKVLGRGLGALIDKVEGPTNNYLLCPVEDIMPNRRQPRKRFDPQTLKELADSIKEKGVIEPLIVRRDSGRYELVVGERRWRASKIAGLKEVPVIIVDATEEESLELAIVENIQREDLNAIEEAEAYRTLLGFGLSQEEVARKVGKERATVSNYLRLLNLPPEVKEEIIKGNLTMGHARAILSLPGHAAQRELCKKVIKKGLSVRATELLATRGSSPATRAAAKVLHLTPIEEEMRKVFATKVSVKERNGKGKIEIEFYSPEERERIIELLRSIF
jgi:ParB family chromosome partitioning protein